MFISPPHSPQGTIIIWKREQKQKGSSNDPTPKLERHSFQHINTGTTTTSWLNDPTLQIYCLLLFALFKKNSRKEKKTRTSAGEKGYLKAYISKITRLSGYLPWATSLMNVHTKVTTSDRILLNGNARFHIVFLSVITRTMDPIPAAATTCKQGKDGRTIPINAYPVAHWPFRARQAVCRKRFLLGKQTHGTHISWGYRSVVCPGSWLPSPRLQPWTGSGHPAQCWNSSPGCALNGTKQ